MLTFAVLVLGLFSVSVLAQNNISTGSDSVNTSGLSELSVSDPGITPDSPFYFLDKASERLSLAFTFNKEKKAKKALKFAEERLAELEEMTQEGKVDDAQKAEEGYSQAVEEATTSLKDVEVDGDLNATEDTLKEVTEMKLKIKAHSEKVAEIKKGVLERLAASNMSEEQLAHLEEVFSRIIDKAEKTELKIEEKKNKVKLKYKVEAKLTDKELEEKEKEIEGEIEKKIKERIKENLPKRAKERVAKAEEKISDAEEKLSVLEAEGKPTNLSSKVLSDAKDALSKAKDALENERYVEAIREAAKARKLAELSHEKGEAISEIAKRIREDREARKELLKKARERAREHIKELSEENKSEKESESEKVVSNEEEKSSESSNSEELASSESGESVKESEETTANPESTQEALNTSA